MRVRARGGGGTGFAVTVSREWDMGGTYRTDAEPPRLRNIAVSAPARREPRGLVSVGPGGVRARPRGGQAGARLDRLRGVPLVPRHGARVLRGRRGRRVDERLVRVRQGRPRGAPGRRRDLHGRRAGDDRPRRLAAERVPDARTARRSTPAPTSRPSRATGCRRGRRCCRRCASRGRRSAPRSTRRPRRSCRGCSGAAALEAPEAPVRPGVPGRRRGRAGAVVRWRARRLGRRAEVPGHLGDRVPAGARRAGDAAADPAADGRGRDLRPDRRRLRPLLRRSRAGSSRTSRRCSTTTRCSPGPTCTRGRSPTTPLFRRVCEETLDWAIRELRQDEGGFASSLDADSRGRRGQVLRLVGRRDPLRARARLADAAIAHFGVTEAGNFEGANILVRATSDPPSNSRDQGAAAGGAGARACARRWTTSGCAPGTR